MARKPIEIPPEIAAKCDASNQTDRFKEALKAVLASDTEQPAIETKKRGRLRKDGK